MASSLMDFISQSKKKIKITPQFIFFYKQLISELKLLPWWGGFSWKRIDREKSEEKGKYNEIKLKKEKYT